MTSDADIQVWLETEQRTQTQVIVPYIQSEQANTLRYTVDTVRQAPQGQSVMRQSGTVALGAGKAVALGRISLSRSPDDNCKVTLTLSAYTRDVKDSTTIWHLQCPEHPT